MNMPVDDGRVGRRQVSIRFLVGTQPFNLAGQLAFIDLTVRCDEEAVFIDAGIDPKARNQTDVRTFRRLDWANTSVVRNMHVADFEARTLAVQTTRAQGRQ